MALKINCNSICIYNSLTWKAIKRITISDDKGIVNILKLQFSPNDRWLAINTNRDYTSLFQVSHWKEKYILQHFTKDIKFSVDNLWIASIGNNNNINLWKIPNYQATK